MRRWFGLLICITCTPIIFYVYQFGVGFWRNNEDWAYLGTYLGGVLGPILTFASVILLLLTLKETRSANKEQLKLLRKQQFDSSFFNTMNSLKLALDGAKYGRSIRVHELYDNFFSEANIWVNEHFEINKYTDLNEDAWETAKTYIRKHQGVFESEAALLIPVLLKVRDLSDEEKEDYVMLMKGLIDNDKRFWLEVYALVWSPVLNYTLKPFLFSSLPTLIQKKITELENSEN
ncbi:hypothetical protein [Vibrio crassostreae]|uniref:hypothetical protein n=1 Tax=Vibrio crassostreae TaxID=246167 RepID=UPI00104FE83C|nr:hypothetical protein [Vibrio crassostreae]TCW22127.1 hypothetical protein EDB48_1013 [Vibrio crassostreae]